MFFHFVIWQTTKSVTNWAHDYLPFTSQCSTVRIIFNSFFSFCRFRILFFSLSLSHNLSNIFENEKKICFSIVYMQMHSTNLNVMYKRVIQMIYHSHVVVVVVRWLYWFYRLTVKQRIFLAVKYLQGSNNRR